MFPLIALFFSSFSWGADCAGYITANFGHYSTFSISRNEIEVARVDYLVHNSTIFIVDTFVESSFRRQGLMSELFDRILELNPGLKRIEGNLTFVNRDAMLEHVDREREMTEQYCKELVRFTPAFKIRSRLGFSQIYKCLWRLGFIEFGAERSF